MKPKATKEQLDLLKEQSFSAETPGTILADFETLLEFIGVEGLASSGKYCRLPLSALSAIDERMRHPLRPNLERPQQLSFPHLNGLYMLLRCTALGITKGAGSRARICIDPALWEEWRSLQPVEQYVALLKFVMYPDWSVVDGSRGSSWESWHNWQTCFIRWTSLLKRGGASGVVAAQVMMGWTDQTSAALLELCGILDLPRVTPKKGENWRICSVQATDFGRALMAAFANHNDEIWKAQLSGNQTGASIEDICFELFSKGHRTLGVSEPVFVDGVWQFKVSLGDVWRRMAVPAGVTVHHFVSEILHAFRFDEDHLYCLNLRERTGRGLRIEHPGVDDADHVGDEFSIGYLPLEPGMAADLLYDYGDNWHFDVKLESIDPEGNSQTIKVLERKGAPPRQYDNDEW